MSRLAKIRLAVIAGGILLVSDIAGDFLAIAVTAILYGVLVVRTFK